MATPPTLDRLQRLSSMLGSCNTQTAQHYVSADVPFTVEDVASIQDAYFDGKGELVVRLSDLPGKICWKSLGAMENRKMVQRLAATCEKVLEGSGAAEKCEAISDVIHQMPMADPEFFSAEGMKKWGVSALAATGGFASLYFLFAGPAHDTWAKIKEKLHNRKGPPDGPSAGTGVSGSTPKVPSGSDAAPVAPPIAEARIIHRVSSHQTDWATIAVLGAAAAVATVVAGVAIAEDFFPVAGGPLNDVPALAAATASWGAYLECF